MGHGERRRSLERRAPVELALRHKGRAILTLRQRTSPEHSSRLSLTFFTRRLYCFLVYNAARDHVIPSVSGGFTLSLAAPQLLRFVVSKIILGLPPNSFMVYFTSTGDLFLRRECATLIQFGNATRGMLVCTIYSMWVSPPMKSSDVYVMNVQSLNEPENQSAAARHLHLHLNRQARPNPPA